MQKRLDYIDAARGLAIICVVYGHAASQMLGTTFFEEHLRLQWEIIFSIVMPLFFIISGAFQRKRFISPDFKHNACLVKVFSSTLIPFYSLSVIFIILNVLMGKFINAPSIRNMVISLLMQQSNGDLLPSGVLWFLFSLFSFSILSYLSFKIFRLNHILVIVFALLIKSNLNTVQNSHYFAFDKLCHYFIFYLFGYVFYRTINEKPLSGVKTLSLILLSYISLFIIESSDVSLFPVLKFVKEVNSLFGIGRIAGSLFVIGVLYEITNKFKSNILIKILNYYGMHSILVYVFHMPTFTIFKLVAVIFSISAGYTYQLLLVIPGITFPLLYGILLRGRRTAYRILLGRDPWMGSNPRSAMRMANTVYLP